MTRDGTAEPVPRDQILRRKRGQGDINFPCSADHEQEWQPYPVDPYSAKCDGHTYIHTYIHSPFEKNVTVRRARHQWTLRTHSTEILLLLRPLYASHSIYCNAFCIAIRGVPVCGPSSRLSRALHSQLDFSSLQRGLVPPSPAALHHGHRAAVSKHGILRGTRHQVRWRFCVTRLSLPPRFFLTS